MDKKIVYFDCDDFSEQNNCLDWLWMLKKQFPKFKVNLFAIPAQCSHKFLDYISSIEWIQLCIHGWKHINNEEISEQVLIDLKNSCYVTIYRAPYWQLSDMMYKKLTKLGYKIMLHPDDLREGIKYNWNIKDSPPNLPFLYAHGHIKNVCSNGIEEASSNIIKLPKDTEFRFL